MSQETFSTWLTQAKPWLAIAAIIFAAGGTYTVFADNRKLHDRFVEESSRLLADHQRVTLSQIEASKVSELHSQELLQQIVTIARATCLNTSKDSGARQGCLQ